MSIAWRIALLAVMCGSVFLPAEAKRLTETGNVPWTYDGDQDGQDRWGVLSTAYVKCELGTEQSPINISYTKQSFKPPLQMRYKAGKATVRHDDNMSVIDIHEPMVLVSEGKEYTLKNITLHSPGEHTVKQRFYPLEIELLHESADGKLVMLSIFAETTAEEPHPAMDAILLAAPMRGGAPADILLDPSGLLPEERGFYNYRGSLTYPPCTERVEWFILRQPIRITREQMKKAAALVGRNARLTQPVYMRTIEQLDASPK